VTPVPIDRDWLAKHNLALLDTCGTGGTAKTFNVSTLAAILAAAAAPTKIAVAKHGNRSRTGRGSAEVLKGLGVNVDASPQVQARCIRETGVCFCFAIHHHPAMKHAGPVRQSLGFPTIFNLLGPLTNPASADYQVMGIYDEQLRSRVASALGTLRCRQAWVMRSEDGLDELSINAPTRIAHLQRDGDTTQIRELIVDPHALGIHAAPLDALVAQDIGDAVRIARSLLAGESGPRRDMLVLNAGAALFVANAVNTLDEGRSLADRTLNNGSAQHTLNALIQISNEPHA